MDKETSESPPPQPDVVEMGSDGNVEKGDESSEGGFKMLLVLLPIYDFGPVIDTDTASFHFEHAARPDNPDNLCIRGYLRWSWWVTSNFEHCRSICV